jgi:leucyl aminopeptidase
MTSAGLPRGTMPPLELLTDAMDTTDATAVTSVAGVAGTEVDVLVVPAFSGENGIELSLAPASPPDTPALFTRETQVALWKALVELGARGRAGETHLLPAVPRRLRDPPARRRARGTPTR